MIRHAYLRHSSAAAGALCSRWVVVGAGSLATRERCARPEVHPSHLRRVVVPALDGGTVYITEVQGETFLELKAARASRFVTLLLDADDVLALRAALTRMAEELL